jgi:demethylmenaquinone methyltransferase/2-methoxy-6-polyprenyl-1,4-benzoquinol methylase
MPDHEITTGARPAGATSEESAAQGIRQMFDTIAPRYDLLNHLLSAGIDRLWWSRSARSLRPILARPEAVVLDLCCGTGDMALALDRYRPRSAADAAPGVTAAPMLAVDFSHEMLALAKAKFAGRNIVAIEADALHLPVPPNSIDLVTCAFGFRNLSNYQAGLAEIYRVLRPRGEIAVLDFNQPRGPLGVAYSLYFRHVLPRLGRLISRDPSAYTYLPASVERFPHPARMIEMMTAAGFAGALWTSYTFGVAGVYRAVKQGG